MRIFIAGATGVVGRRVVPRLLELGHDVTATARDREKRAALEQRGVRALDVDLFSQTDLTAALAGHDVVINLATHIPASSLRTLLPGAWRENDRLRTDAAMNLAVAGLAAGARHFIQESFAPAYPDRGDAWIDEGAALEPTGHTRSIEHAENAARHFARHGTAAILRFAWFYGPDSRFLHEQMAMVRRGLGPLFGPAGSFISSVAHDDAAAAVVTALELPSGNYNVSDDEPLHHRDFVDALADAMGVDHPRLPPAWLALLAGSIGEMLSRSQRFSNAKLRRHGWSPRYPSVRQGFRAVIDSLEKQTPLPSRRELSHG